MNDRFSIKVTRSNTGTRQPEYETLTCHTIVVRHDGTLSIEGDSGGLGLAAGLWEAVDVRVLPNGEDS